MRSFLTYGFISLVGIAALYACGDDSGDGTPGPQGGSGGGAGTAGAGGGAGAAGTAGSGAGGGAGTAGNGGAGGAGPDVTPIATCTGCVELITPVTGPNDNGSTTNLADQAIFQFSFPTPGVDFTNGVVTWRVMALGNNDNYFLNTFAQNGPPDGYNGVYPTYTALSATNFPANTWVNVVLNLAAYRGTVGADAGTDAGSVVVDAGADAGDAGAPLDPGTFIKERVQAIGIQLGVTPAFTGSAVVHLAIDSVTITGVPGQTGFNFDTTAEGLAANTYQLPPGTPAPVHH